MKVLFLDKKLYGFGITNTVLCSFCKTLEETPIHIFYDCIHIKYLWERLQTKFLNDIILPSLTLGLTMPTKYTAVYVTFESQN